MPESFTLLHQALGRLDDILNIDAVLGSQQFLRPVFNEDIRDTDTLNMDTGETAFT